MVNAMGIWNPDLSGFWMVKQIGLQMVQIKKGIWNLEVWAIKIKQMEAIQKNHLKSRQKCPDFEWSGFWKVETIAIAKTRPFEIWPLKSPDFKCFWIFNGQISDPQCISVKLSSFYEIYNKIFIIELTLGHDMNFRLSHNNLNNGPVVKCSTSSGKMQQALSYDFIGETTQVRT